MNTDLVDIRPYGQFVRRLASRYVSNPNKLEIETEFKLASNLVMVRITGFDKQDSGFLIGAQGRAFRALQDLLKAFAIRGNRLAKLEIMEASRSSSQSRSTFTPKARWESQDDDVLAALLKEVLDDILEYDFDVWSESLFGDYKTTLIIKGERSLDAVLLNAVAILFQAIGRRMGREEVRIEIRTIRR